jgi:hypothetical protein
MINPKIRRRNPTSGISKQRLENLLDAVNNEEKKIQGKVNASKVKENQQKTERLVIKIFRVNKIQY